MVPDRKVADFYSKMIHFTKKIMKKSPLMIKNELKVN